MDKLYIIKIGGNIIDDEQKLAAFLEDFSNIDGRKILVHGGGKLATRMADTLGIQQQMIDGRRITDAETLRIVTMVYAGYINKNIVAKLQSFNCNAMGLCGADGDYGFVGDVDAINTDLADMLLSRNIALVFAPITHDQQGQLLNTNADTIAQELAKGLSTLYEVSLVYSFEKSGVLLNADDDSTVIPSINPDYYQQLKAQKKIFAGMLPKLDNAFTALNSGVSRVIIGKAEQLHQLIQGSAGTTIVNE